jgi:hypothetical protein
VYTSINRHRAAQGAEDYRREEQYLHDGFSDHLCSFPIASAPGDPLRAFPFSVREMSSFHKTGRHRWLCGSEKSDWRANRHPSAGRRRSSSRQIGRFTDSRSEPLIQAPGPTAVAHNRKEHWQSLLYELWQAAGGDSWDRRIKWSCSSPVPTRHCLTACWKLGSPSSMAEDLLHYRRSCGWQWAGTTSA